MVVEYAGGDLAQLLGGHGDAVALFRVRAHEVPLLLGERGGLVEDLQRDAQLADVVQQAQQRKRALVVVGQLQALAQLGGQRAGAAHVGLCGGVALAHGLVERVEQRGVRGIWVEHLLHAQAALGQADGGAQAGLVPGELGDGALDAQRPAAEVERCHVAGDGGAVLARLALAHAGAAGQDGGVVHACELRAGGEDVAHELG